MVQVRCVVSLPNPQCLLHFPLVPVYLSADHLCIDPVDAVVCVVGMDHYAIGGLSALNCSLVLLEAKFKCSACLSHVGAVATAIHFVNYSFRNVWTQN